MKPKHSENKSDKVFFRNSFWIVQGMAFVRGVKTIHLSHNPWLTLIIYSMRLWEWGSTTASTHMSGLTWVVRRYVMRSNSPSGGINEMVRSFSNRASRTHLGQGKKNNTWRHPVRKSKVYTSTIDVSTPFHLHCDISTQGPLTTRGSMISSEERCTYVFDFPRWRRGVFWNGFSRLY